MTEMFERTNKISYFYFTITLHFDICIALSLQQCQKFKLNLHFICRVIVLFSNTKPIAVVLEQQCFESAIIYTTQFHQKFNGRWVTRLLMGKKKKEKKLIFIKN